MPDNDAFGGEAYDGPTDAEVFETGDATPQGTVVEVEESDQGTAGEEASWLDAIDDPAIRDAASKYQSPAELARATVEAQRKLGEQGNEIGQLREMFQELMNGQQQPDYGPMPTNGQPEPGPPGFGDVEEFAGWAAQQVRNGEMEPEQAMADVARAVSRVTQQQLAEMRADLEQSVNQRLDQSLTPVRSFQTEQAMGGQIKSLQREFGDDVYNSLREATAAKLRQWGNQGVPVAQDPRFIRTAFIEAFAEQSLSERRASQAHTLDGSGPGQAPRTVDPAALILEGIDQAGAHSTGDYF